MENLKDYFIELHKKTEKTLHNIAIDMTDENVTKDKLVLDAMMYSQLESFNNYLLDRLELEGVFYNEVTNEYYCKLDTAKDA